MNPIGKIFEAVQENKQEKLHSLFSFFAIGFGVAGVFAVLTED